MNFESALDIYLGARCTLIKSDKTTRCLSCADCTIHYYPLCLHENNTLYFFLRSLLWSIEAYVPMRHYTTAWYASQQYGLRLLSARCR